MNFPKKEESALESIEHELYDPKAKVTDVELHHAKSHRSLDLPTSWGDESHVFTHGKEAPGLSFGVKLLLVATLFLFTALAFTSWRVLSLRNVVSSSNIEMNADITPFIEGGETTPLVVSLRNKNASRLEAANITLLYKQGNGSQDEQEKIQEKRDLGTINPGEYKRQDFAVILYGAEGETRNLTVKLEYKVAGSNALFSKIGNAQVVLRAPPVAVHVEGPERLSIGQTGVYTFTVTNNAASSSLPAVLTLVLPNSFIVTDASPKAVSRSSSWAIESLLPGQSKTVTLTGSFTGKQGETATFQAKVGSQGDGPTVLGIVYSSESKDVALHSSPLTMTMNMLTDHGGTESMKYGDRAAITIGYSNTSNQALSDVSLTLAVSGEAALYDVINPTNGYYDSSRKTITWDKASLPDLAVLAPNSQGTVQVIIPIVTKGSNSPALKLSLVGAASMKDQETVTTLNKTWGVQGSASLEASTQHQTSPFTNSGPIPPEANKETTYTAHLSITTQNALSSAKVSFTLPAYVVWKGVSSHPQDVVYDTRTRTVTWNTGRLTEGVVTSIDVQLGVKPSQSHVGQSPAITSGIILDADEEVSGAHLRMTRTPLTTSLRNEQWPANPSMVVSR